MSWTARRRWANTEMTRMTTSPRPECLMLLSCSALPWPPRVLIVEDESIIALATKANLKRMGCDVVADYREARRKLGVVPQELVFDPFFSALGKRVPLKASSLFFILIV